RLSRTARRYLRQAGFRKLNWPPFFSGQKVSKKPPKSQPDSLFRPNTSDAVYSEEIGMAHLPLR
ncbi:MAG: hypothetical protein AAF399_06860, partial [Bacteroidota bacterium]